MIAGNGFLVHDHENMPHWEFPTTGRTTTKQGADGSSSTTAPISPIHTQDGGTRRHGGLWRERSEKAFGEKTGPSTEDSPGEVDEDIAEVEREVPELNYQEA